LLFKSLIFFISCFSALQADYCQDIFDDLKVIIHGADGVDGELESVIPFPNQGGSFINQVYLICTDKGEQLVLKVENANWQKEKTLNEVLTLEYINRYTTIPVPKVLAYENAMDDSLINYEYILMTRMKGEPLNHEFERIYADKKTYHRVLEQLADILAELKQVPYSSIGSLKCPATLELKCPIDFVNLGKETPCASFSEYVRRWLNYYLGEMKVLKDSGHQNSSYFEKHIPQVEKLLSLDLLKLDNALETFPFSHQDFVMKNILVDGEMISAVLDWEWSGTAVSEFESKTGCDFLKTSEDRDLFNRLLAERGVFHFFDPPHEIRQLFYQLTGELYTLISCYEWIEGKLEHSAKFLDQKLEQRRIRASEDFDIRSYVEETSLSLDVHYNRLKQELL